jgi:hypothetical protein
MPVNSPIYLPLQQQEDTPDFSGQPHVGLIEGIQGTIAHDLQYGTTAQSIEALSDAIRPGKVLTSDEYEQSQWKRPGVTFPHGVSEARAKRSAERHDDQVTYQDQMSGMTNNVLSKAGRVAGNLIGFGMDPINIGAIGAAVASGGALSEPLAAAAAEYGTTAALGAKFATGALEGALATAPAVAMDYGSGTFYGEDPTMLHAVGALAINAALGGLLHTAFGSKAIIAKDSHYKAMETGVNQLESGKSVQADEAVQNGAYQAGIINDTRTANLTPEELEQQQLDQRQSMLSDMQERRAQLEPLDGFDDLKQKVDDQIAVLKGDKQIDSIPDDIVDPSDDIKGKPLNPTQILNGDYDADQIRGLHDENMVLAKNTSLQLNSNYAELLSNQIRVNPIDAVQLRGSAKKIMGFEGDNTTNVQELNDIKAQTPPDDVSDDIDELQRNVQDIREKLPEDLQDAFDEIGKIQGQHNKVADEVQNYVNCIKGGGIKL